MTRVPVNVILLAAGSGSRMGALTQNTHKSLLPLAGTPALERVLDEVLARPVQQVVVVTGDKRESVEAFVRARYRERVTLVYNERFASDMNILSADLGVTALRRPGEGYLIVETDIVIGPGGWERVLVLEEPEASFWITRGTYGPSLTGGCLDTDPSGQVTGLAYAPTYTPSCEGWQKLLGILYVGWEEVERDRAVRRSAMDRTIAQYYMTPWVENLATLPCRARPLGEVFAGSFNDGATYQDVDRRFTEALAEGRA